MTVKPKKSVYDGLTSSDYFDALRGRNVESINFELFCELAADAGLPAVGLKTWQVVRAALVESKQRLPKEAPTGIPSPTPLPEFRDANRTRHRVVVKGIYRGYVESGGGKPPKFFPVENAD